MFQSKINFNKTQNLIEFLGTYCLYSFVLQKFVLLTHQILFLSCYNLLLLHCNDASKSIQNKIFMFRAEREIYQVYHLDPAEISETSH